MDCSPHYDVALWETHTVEDDCTLVIRTSNGRAFYCQISPSEFHRSPLAKEQYLKCLDLLRSGEEDEDFCIEDACDCLSKPFEPLIARLAPAALEQRYDKLPTLAQYLFPPHFVCSLTATDENMEAVEAASQDHGWGEPLLSIDRDFLNDIDSWTISYHPEDVDICYDSPRDVLIKPPRKVVVGRENSDRDVCYFKRFNVSFGPKHAKNELIAHRRIAKAQLPSPPETWLCRLHGVVREGNKLAGMLFHWIDSKGVLSKARAGQSSPQQRKLWAAQIGGTLEKLHGQGIIWGDAKADNILIDAQNNAWMIDFGGSYTVGWVDEDKAGTVEGDMQGFEKIMDVISAPDTSL